MGLYPPVRPVFAPSPEEESWRRQVALNDWLCGVLDGHQSRLEQVTTKITSMEIELRATQEVASDLKEKLDKLLTAISEEIEPLQGHAPKTMRIAAELAVEYMDEPEGPNGEGPP